LYNEDNGDSDKVGPSDDAYSGDFNQPEQLDEDPDGQDLLSSDMDITAGDHLPVFKKTASTTKTSGPRASGKTSMAGKNNKLNQLSTAHKKATVLVEDSDSDSEDSIPPPKFKLDYVRPPKTKLPNPPRTNLSGSTMAWDAPTPFIGSKNVKVEKAMVSDF
jgi:hypothetical protein